MKNITSTTGMTPMLTQYWEIKKQYPDAIVFYRMGDFYEMFFDDALTAAPILEVQLTSRDKSAVNPIPMCGVPYHAATQYLQKLLAKGLKVAICEQMEDPSLAKGLVKRDVIRIVTPALIGDPSLVSEESSNWLVCLWKNPSVSFNLRVVFFDLLSGQIREGEINTEEEARGLFLKMPPKEILVPESVKELDWFVDLKSYCKQATLTFRNSYFTGEDTNAICLAALTQYLSETQKAGMSPYVEKPLPLSMLQQVQIDSTTIASLEIIRNSGSKDGTTLFDILNFTKTPMGRRLLRDWLLSPLSDLEKIQERLDAVDCLLEDATTFTKLCERLSQIRDLERLTTKTALGLAMPRDLVAIRSILKIVPELKNILINCKSKKLGVCSEQLDSLKDLHSHLQEALLDEPAATLRDGGIFQDSFHTEIEECRRLSLDAKSTIANMEAREKQRTLIPSLKIKYSKVFGYTIEVTKAYLSKVPSEYIRKQTVSNGERFITEELKVFEEKAITAEYRLKSLEERLFYDLRKKVSENASALLSNSRLIAELDVLVSFTRVSKDRGYKRPQIQSEGSLRIENSRHPVIETILAPGQFVPNSIEMNKSDSRTLVITGPNMGGKSTIMRQIALTVLMAHAGCFVPAEQAVLPLTDAIFTRIGSSDDLTRGRSTFMVEMTEVARIIEKATSKSLIIIDEIGRGTSTYDGLSLAWSILEHLHNKTCAFTLFATHFHELTKLEKSHPALKNANVLVQKWKGDIVFLYKLSRGICNQSYGIEVAKLAGLPDLVLDRARHILDLLEANSKKSTKIADAASESTYSQLALFDESGSLNSKNLLESELL